MKDKKLIELLGNMAEKSPKLHTTNHDYGFNFNHNTFMQKLVSNDTTKAKFWIHPDDYFKSLIAIDYYKNVLFNDAKPVEDLEIIFEKMGSTAEITGKDVAKELYMSIVDRLYESPIEPMISSIEDRCEKSNVKFEAKGKPSVYYKIIGEMVFDIVSKENRKYLGKVESLNDLRSLVFCDLMEDYSRNPRKIKGYLDKGRFTDASLEIIRDIGKNIAVKEEEELSKSQYIKDIVECFSRESSQTIATLISQTKIEPELVEKGLNYLLEKNVLAKSENYINGTVYYLKYTKGGKNGTK